MVRIWHFHCRGPGSIPGWETEIPKAVWPKKRKKKNPHTKNQIYFSQFWRLEVQDQGASRVGFWWDCLPCLQRAAFSQCPHKGFFSVCTHLWCLFFFLATLHGMQDLSSLTRDWTVSPSVEVQSPNHWTAREFPGVSFLKRTPVLLDYSSTPMTSFNLNHPLKGFSSE